MVYCMWGLRIILQDMRKYEKVTAYRTDFNEDRVIKALVWPVATYGCESWTLRKNEQTRLDAFEMK